MTTKLGGYMTDVPVWVPITALGVAMCSAVIAIFALVETRRNNRASGALVRFAHPALVLRNYQAGLDFDLINSGRTDTTLIRVDVIHPRFKGLQHVEELSVSSPRNSRKWYLDGKPIRHSHTTSLQVDLSVLSRWLLEYNSRPGNIFICWFRRLLLSASIKLVITLGNGKKVKERIPIQRVNRIAEEVRRAQEADREKYVESAREQLHETLKNLQIEDAGL
ncbi:hypothetical protein [Arthrobacter sp. Soil736]|uniref:hypothetical protein n=1 Tax=Arthrobacter sp. Soil736 TaxID=1736395 RepID=UPI0012F9FE4E|nr:hypothetical protein [Arthrobacter sp. Soil736]